MRKILFLPHCLNESERDYLREEAEQRGYEVYVVKGGSQAKRILAEKSEGLEGVVGVVCVNEIEHMREFLQQNYSGAQVSAITLLSDGCENTQVNVGEVLRVL
jgi:hypothetical protein